MVVMQASEVSTAALYIDDDNDDDDGIITNAKTAKRHRFGSEVNINHAVV